MSDTYDVAVIGGGISGVAAARDLADRGYSVVVLEGGNRLGGRTFAGPFDGLDGVVVDFGGSWVNRKLQPLIRRETSRYNITLKEDVPVESAVFFTGGQRRTFPVPPSELSDLERAMAHLRDASKRFTVSQPIIEQALSDLDVPPDVFFAPLQLPQATRDLVYGMLAAYVGNEPNKTSMLNIVAQVAAFGQSPYGFYGALTERFVGGTSRLLDRMVAGSDVKVRLSHRVVRIQQSRHGVSVRTADGVLVAARECIVAVPTNVIRHIEFAPELSAEKQAATAHNHMGRLIKPIIHARHMPTRVAALGMTTLHMIVTAAELPDGSSILYSFASEAIGDLDPTDKSSVQRALRVYFPDAEVLAVQSHDWLADPLFDGTPRIDPPAESYEFLRVMNESEGRIVFAGTDVDTSVWRTWMEGALNSAQHAVDIVSVNLAQRPI